MRQKYMDWQLLLIIFSALITAGLAINAHISNKKSEKTLEQKQDSLQKTQVQLIEAQAELLKYNTGADSYCFLVPGDYSSDSCTLKIINTGKYPLYDVDLILVDINLLESSEKVGQIAQHASEIWKKIKIGNINPGNWQIIKNLSIDRTIMDRKFNAFFTARNGVFKQQTIIRIKNNTLYAATYITNKDDQEIAKKISNGFLNKNENVDFPQKPVGELILGNLNNN